MLDLAVAISIVLSSTGVLLAGVARLRMVRVWMKWAERCDPMNPNFRPPLISRK
jgi:hypothetical protein